LLHGSAGASTQSDDAAAAYQAGDYETAARLWRNLAEQGDMFAQRAIAVMLDYGQGVSQNLAEAPHWYMRAAEQGLPSAQSRLGVLYAMGRGVPQDHAAAAKWQGMAAEQGFPPAQRLLGLAYASGWGVQQDLVQAYKWLKLAEINIDDAESLPPPSRRTLARSMNPQQMALAKKLVREWRRKTWAELKTTR
jgi:TPR repeat protein